MPYFVFAVHTDSTVNRLYHDGPINNFQDALNLEADMNRGRAPGDNYIVTMVQAENEEEAVRRIIEFRRQRGLPT